MPRRGSSPSGSWPRLGVAGSSQGGLRQQNVDLGSGRDSPGLQAGLDAEVSGKGCLNVGARDDGNSSSVCIRQGARDSRETSFER